MTILLASVTLPDLLWNDEYSGYEPIASAALRRLDGGLALYPRPQWAGRPVTLTAGADHGLTHAQVTALAALAADATATYALVFPTRANLTLMVAFRHHDPPVLDVSPLIDYAAPASADPWVGSIKLITV
jgi:hypothetical protein